MDTTLPVFQAVSPSVTPTNVPGQTTMATILHGVGSRVIPTEGNVTSWNRTLTSESDLDYIDDYGYDYNSTYDPGQFDNYEVCRYERHGATFLPVLYSLFFLLGLAGNSLVIWVICCGVRLRSMTDVCLVNLALADLLLACTLPFQAHQARDRWPFGDGMCKLVLGVYHVVLYSGIFFISLMSIDRYLAIVHAVYAMRVRTRTFGLAAAAVTWAAGFFASFPDVLFLQQHSLSNKCIPVYSSSNSTDSGGHFWGVFSLFKMNLLALFVPVCIMGFCYTQIVRRLLSSRSSKKPAVRLVLVVAAVFLCCWLPYNVASLFKALELLHVYTACGSSRAIRTTLEVTEALAYAHSCLNPILYVFVGQKFRKQLVRLVHRAPCRLCQLVKAVVPLDRAGGSVYSVTTSLEERSTAV